MRVTNKGLKEILKRVEKSITVQNKDNSETEYNCIEISNSGDTVEVIATNSETDSQIIYDTGIESKEDATGSIFLNKKDVTKIKKLKSDFDFDFVAASLNSGKFNISLVKPHKSVEFGLNLVIEKPIMLSDKVKNNISHIIKVADKNNPKYELNGILIENISNDLNIVSTDTRRLAVLNDALDYNDFAINPNKHALELVNWLDVEFMLLSEKHLIIKEKNITHNIGLILGRYPEYKRIVPKEYSKTVKIASCQFKNMLDECKIFGGDLSINENSSIQIFDKDSVEATYKHNFDFEDINISFAINYASDAVGGENIDFCFNETNLPFTIDNGNYKTIIMPIYF